MGFVVATESALRPRAYFSLRALAHYLEREARSHRQVFQLRLIDMLSVLPLIRLGEMLPDFLLAL